MLNTLMSFTSNSSGSSETTLIAIAIMSGILAIICICIRFELMISKRVHQIFKAESSQLKRELMDLMQNAENMTKLVHELEKLEDDRVNGAISDEEYISKYTIIMDAIHDINALVRMTYERSRK